MTRPTPIPEQTLLPGGEGVQSLTAFDYSPRTTVIFGVNTIERVGELSKAMGCSHILLVTDPGIVAAGHAVRVANLIENAGLKVTWFDRVRENPSTSCVQSCVETAKAAGIDGIIGLGGGSSMDTAKGCNFILTNG